MNDKKIVNTTIMISEPCPCLSLAFLKLDYFLHVRSLLFKWKSNLLQRNIHPSFCSIFTGFLNTLKFTVGLPPHSPSISCCPELHDNLFIIFFIFTPLRLEL